MKEYRVVWEIDIYAESPEDAARKALDIQKREDSTATVFEVFDRNELAPGGVGASVTVDLDELDAIDLDDLL